MAKENSQKIKLLKLIEMFRQETDEQHPMLATTVCKRLAEMEISCDRRTLTKDIATLNEFGYEVMSAMVGHEKAYYVEDRSFSVPELKILIDAVQAASFITEKKTAQLIDKLADLGGGHRAALLKSNMIYFNTLKHRNEAIFYNVDYLEAAIEKKVKVIFRYFDLNENGEKVYRRDKHHYVVEPVALVFNDENYYLVAYSGKHDSVSHYRIDKMDGVEVIEDAVCDKALELRDSLRGYTEQLFGMYGGPQESVTLQFNNDLIGVVFDKFGEDTKMIRVGENACVATVKVQISPAFWGWVLGFAGQMKILSPENAVSEYKTQIATLANTIGAEQS